MKALRLSLLFNCLALVFATSLVSASVPIMGVKITNGTGKLVFNGKTDGTGLFATKALAPGEYVVQFSSSSAKGGPFVVVVSAGKKKVVADSVPAEKFFKGGIAMRLKVDKAMNVTGQVSGLGQLTSQNGTQQADGKKVKYVNGKKYVWVQNELGSNIGGHWVDANSAEARNVQNLGRDAVQDYQSRPQFPGGGN